RQNRRVYLVAFMDDHSRFLVGYGLHASQSGALVLEVLRAGLASYGAPEEILTDNGSQDVTWRGKSAFSKGLRKRGVRQVGAVPAADPGQDRALLGDAVAGVRRGGRLPGLGGRAKADRPVHRPLQLPAPPPGDRRPRAGGPLLRGGAGGAAGAEGAGGGERPAVGPPRRAPGALLPDRPGGRPALQRARRGGAGDPDPGRP